MIQGWRREYEIEREFPCDSQVVELVTPTDRNHESFWKMLEGLVVHKTIIVKIISLADLSCA